MIQSDDSLETLVKVNFGLRRSGSAYVPDTGSIVGVLTWNGASIRWYGEEELEIQDAVVDLLQHQGFGRVIPMLEREFGPGSSASGGPAWRFPDDVSAQHLPPDIDLVLSPERSTRDLRRPGNWASSEWAALREGALGPWAMLVVGRDPVCVCFTPEMGPSGAECGVWTRGDMRRKGLASVAVENWFRIANTTWRHLFYSTSDDNTASIAVAARLRLIEIGRVYAVRT